MVDISGGGDVQYLPESKGTHMAWYDKRQTSQTWNQDDAKDFVREHMSIFVDAGFSGAIATPTTSPDPDGGHTNFLDVTLIPSPDCECETMEVLTDYFGGVERDGRFSTLDKSGRWVMFKIARRKP